MKIDLVLELREGACADCHLLGENIGLTTAGGLCTGSVAGDLVGVFGSENLGVLGSDTADGAAVVAESLVSESNAGWCS